MLVLDENLPARQRQLLRDWRIRFRVIGVDVAPGGPRMSTCFRCSTVWPSPPFAPWTAIFTGPTGLTQLIAWFGSMCEAGRRPSSSGAS